MRLQNVTRQGLKNYKTLRRLLEEGSREIAGSLFKREGGGSWGKGGKAVLRERRARKIGGARLERAK